jgi:SAM-dependent methyltransferase
MTDHPGADLFDVWRTYRKVVDSNYMNHAEFSAALKRVLRMRFGGRPFSVLDLGCGDAGTLAPVLLAAGAGSYEGVDLSATALALAAQNLESLSCPVQLSSGDLLDALRDGDRRFDVIHASYAVHHLSTGAKAEFFVHAARRLNGDGLILLADVVRREDESLPVYHQRYCERLRSDWRNLSEDEKDAVCDHLVNNDYPETTSKLMALAREAGLEDVEELARFGWHGLYRFART